MFHRTAAIGKWLIQRTLYHDHSCDAKPTVQFDDIQPSYIPPSRVRHFPNRTLSKTVVIEKVLTCYNRPSLSRRGGSEAVPFLLGEGLCRSICVRSKSILTVRVRRTPVEPEVSLPELNTLSTGIFRTSFWIIVDTLRQQITAWNSNHASSLTNGFWKRDLG